MNFEQLYKSESIGSELCFGIDIKVAGTNVRSEGLIRAAYQAAELLEQAITREFYAHNEEAQERALAQRVDLINCFPERPIYVKPIPNGYCNRACCEHKPWFQVTTRLGVIIIGWRKSVISIDWSGSAVAYEATALFTNEDVTKDRCLIHAWSYEKAREYLRTLFEFCEG